MLMTHFFVQAPVDGFSYLTRIQYKAENVPADGRFGESEIDYILFMQRDVELNVNPNEVKSTQYLSKDGLKQFLGKKQAYLADTGSHLVHVL